MLGRISPDGLLGGRMVIHPELSVEAMATIAKPFGGNAHAGAQAVLRIANVNMERALRIVSVERGHDARDFTLVAFGGAGPLHACSLAEALRIPCVLIPPHPGVLSALGMAMAPIVKNLSAAVMLSVDGENGGAGRSADASTLQILARSCAELEERGRQELESEGFGLEGLAVQVFLDMRYAGQSYELAVPTESVAPAEFLPAFHAAHQTRFGHSDLSRAVEVITLRVKLILPGIDTENRKEETEKRKTKRAASTHQSEVWFEGKPVATSIYERDDLLPGFRFAGPAVVAQMDSTTAVPLGWRCEVDEMNNLLLATV